MGNVGEGVALTAYRLVCSPLLTTWDWDGIWEVVNVSRGLEW